MPGSGWLPPAGIPIVLGLRRIGLRHREGEFAVLSVFRAYRDGFPVRLNDSFGNIHPETYSGLIQAATLVALVEYTEDPPAEFPAPRCKHARQPSARAVRRPPSS